ncbi:hypothetical protein HPB51_012155 [Rhipicephalus microplus]|uniref:Uncharacterized protein n=1 Tax=Rhipicephalus microplus TaxID=6941 RepID=A0A9J6DM88_RHIMP|nr:hypothetical protein HPB51_012155 [Rhipicephalus microplus]
MKFGQRRLCEPKMATAPCSVDVFEQLNDAARVEANRSVVSEADVLRTEVGQLKSELEELKLMILKDHDAAKDHDAPKPPLDPQMKAIHDLLCNLLAQLVEHIEILESTTHENFDVKSTTSADESIASMNLKRGLRKQQRLKTHENSDAELSPSVEESSAWMILKRGSRKQQRQDRSEAPMCTSKSEDTRDRLSSFAVSSSPHLRKDLCAWFHQVDYWFRTSSVTDEATIPFITSRLPAKDFTWMRHQTKLASIGTWAGMKAAFRRRNNMDYHVTSKQRMFGGTQHAGEPCTDFAYRKLDLMEQYNYPVLQQEKRQVIITTLSPKAKKHFFDKTFRRLYDIISSFLRFDQTRDSEDSIYILAAEERNTPSTMPSAECRGMTMCSPRKPIRHSKRADSIESNCSSADQVAQGTRGPHHTIITGPDKGSLTYQNTCFATRTAHLHS